MYVTSSLPSSTCASGHSCTPPPACTACNHQSENEHACTASRNCALAPRLVIVVMLQHVCDVIAPVLRFQLPTPAAFLQEYVATHQRKMMQVVQQQRKAQHCRSLPSWRCQHVVHTLEYGVVLAIFLRSGDQLVFDVCQRHPLAILLNQRIQWHLGCRVPTASHDVILIWKCWGTSV